MGVFQEWSGNPKSAKSDFMKRFMLPTYNKMKHYNYYDVIQTLTQNAFLKQEAEKKLKAQFMNAEGGNEIDILKGIEEELLF